MSKADTVLKKAIAYEILSLYGNRSSYLQALAQQDETWQDVARRQGDVPDTIPAPPPADPNAPQKIDVPEQTISAPAPATKGSLGDPNTVYLLQIFLNKAFKNDIINGRKGPIAEDYKWGPETAGRLKEWGSRNGIPSSDVRQIANLALQQSK